MKRSGEPNGEYGTGGYAGKKLKSSTCRHWARGHCQLGDACGFAHGPTQQSASQPTYDPYSQQSAPQQPSYAPSSQYGSFGDAQQPQYGQPQSSGPRYDPYGQQAPLDDQPAYGQQPYSYAPSSQGQQAIPQYAPQQAFVQHQASGGDQRQSRFGERPRMRCRHWARGFCQLGGECNFAHTGPPGPDHTTPADNTNVGQVDCRHWIGKGYCQMGAACNFLHSGTPGSGSVGGGFQQDQVDRPERKKTIVCRHFARGHCSRGESCGFLHEGAHQQHQLSHADATTELINSQVAQAVQAAKKVSAQVSAQVASTEHATTEQPERTEDSLQ